MRISRRFKIFLALVVIVGAGYFAGNRLGLSSSNGASTDFKEARFQGAIIAQDIVNLSNGVNGELGRINTLDDQQNYTEALTLTVELLRRTQEVRLKALELSAQLEKMTGALTTIKEPEARGAALQSISNRLALIGRLLSYGDYLTQLVNSLNKRFSGEVLPPNHIKNLVAQVNAEVTAINNFNREAGEAMDRFDEVLKEEK